MALLRFAWLLPTEPRAARALALGGLLALLLAAAPFSAWAQNAPQGPQPALVPPGTPQRPSGPPPGGFPSELGGDRPRVAPESLREGRILPDSGVEVGAGPLFVSVESHQLQIKQGPKDFLSDGAILSADVVLEDWRFSYSKVLLRRQLDTGTLYRGTPVDFLGVDVDQFWAYYGFRPIHALYLGAGVAYEYRLTRLSSAGVNVATVTENLGAAGFIADWAVASPITLQLRVFLEEGGHLVGISGATVQLGYIVPF